MRRLKRDACCAFLCIAIPVGAVGQGRIEVTPQPVGTAARLVISARSADAGFDTDSMVEAGQAPPAGVRARTGLELYQATLGVSSQLSTQRVSGASNLEVGSARVLSNSTINTTVQNQLVIAQPLNQVGVVYTGSCNPRTTICAGGSSGTTGGTTGGSSGTTGGTTSGSSGTTSGTTGGSGGSTGGSSGTTGGTAGGSGGTTGSGAGIGGGGGAGGGTAAGTGGGGPTNGGSSALDLLRERARIDNAQRVASVLEQKVRELQALREERGRVQQERERQIRDIQGPSPLGAINLLEGLYVDPGVQIFQSSVLQIDHHVYQDANPETGVFYYAPKRYDLSWSPATQYAMTVIYGMAGATADEGEVYMAARLTAGVVQRDIQVARELLLSYLRRRSRDGVIPFRELRPIPLRGASDVQLFGGAQNEFSIERNRINIHGITDVLGNMDVSWATDVRRLLNVESLLRTDAGIQGTITLHGAGRQELSLTLPIEVAVASPTTFGPVAFDRASGWTNQTLYPITLHGLHALVLSPEDGSGLERDQPLVLSWELGETVVAPGQGVAWNDRYVPSWVEGMAKVLWVAYSVDGACEPCDDQVFDEQFIPSPPRTHSLVVTTGNLFEATGAHRVAVHVRSPYLDPQRKQITQRPPVYLEEDGVEAAVAQLFLTANEFGGDGASLPFYEFRLDLEMRDGQIRPTPWMPSRQLDLLIGSATIEALSQAGPETGATP